MVLGKRNFRAAEKGASGGSGGARGPVRRRGPLTPSIEQEIERKLRKPVAEIVQDCFPRGRKRIDCLGGEFVFLNRDYKRFFGHAKTHEIAKALQITVSLAKKMRLVFDEHGDLTKEVLGLFLIFKLGNRHLRKKFGV